MRRLPAIVLLAGLLLASAPASAGASLLVDDAGTTADSHCQLESWVRTRPGALESTLMPACAWGGFEYSVGASAWPAGPQGPLVYAAVKRTLIDTGGQTPGVALALAGDWRRHDGALADASANLSSSFHPGSRVTLNVDMGWRVARAGHGRLTSGVGIEYRPVARWSWLAEAYAEGGGYRAGQAGVRLHLAHAVSLDWLCGYERGGSHWLTLGFNWSPGDAD
jgi:hypothetical protein